MRLVFIRGKDYPRIVVGSDVNMCGVSIDGIGSRWKSGGEVLTAITAAAQ